MLTDIDLLCPDRERQFVSLGRLCAMLDATPAQVAVLADEVNVKFSLVMDGIGYFAVPDALLIAQKCRQVREEIDGKLSSAPFN